jgi:hypothetical protein
MRHWRIFATCLLSIASLPLLAYAQGASSSPNEAKPEKKAQPASTQQNVGEQKFAQHCGRCHTPPEGFSAHISGTIVRHMRVRASLSKQDEQDILRFFNPQ